MFEIPEDLPLSLAPLAWVVGRWQGWGTMVTPGEEPDAVIIQEINADMLGDQLRVVTTLYAGTATGPIDWEMNAGEGLEAIEAGEFLREETSYWRMATPLAIVPAEGEEPREMQATSSDTAGLATLWVGAVMGPRIRLGSDVIAKDASAGDITAAYRMYGLVGGELFWTAETQVEQEDPRVQFSGRLRRVNRAGADE